MRRARSIAPALVAGALGGATVAQLRRMECEYARTETLSPNTVVTMYAAHGAYAAALVWAGRRRIWPVRLPTRSARIVGASSIAVGGGVALAGARPFDSGAQISGIEGGNLHAVTRNTRGLRHVDDLRGLARVP
ncbi:MAG: hypothetical protein L0H25_08795 [Micrococcales bacterium]|nr:hypothetical protein [Micrococcales bacterium]